MRILSHILGTIIVTSSILHTGFAHADQGRASGKRADAASIFFCNLVNKDVLDPTNIRGSWSGGDFIQNMKTEYRLSKKGTYLLNESGDLTFIPHVGSKPLVGLEAAKAMAAEFANEIDSTTPFIGLGLVGLAARLFAPQSILPTEARAEIQKYCFGFDDRLDFQIRSFLGSVDLN